MRRFRKRTVLPVGLGPWTTALILVGLGATALLLPSPIGLALAGVAGLAVLAICVAQFRKTVSERTALDPVTGLLLRPAFDAAVEVIAAGIQRDQTHSALFLLEVTRYSKLVEQHGQRRADETMRVLASQIRSALRKPDLVARYSDARFAICLSPMPQREDERCLALARQLQDIWEKTPELDQTQIHLRVRIGFCHSEAVANLNAERWVSAANLALKKAHNPASPGVEPYTEVMQQADLSDDLLRHQVQQALQSGQIRAWFQPQISAKTHSLSGFEVLARWQHPEKGLVAPDGFIPMIEALGQLHRLSDLMLRQALDALKAWDAEGLEVPMMGINFSAAELSNPRLVDRIIWELDRADLAPHRLAIEVLESVVASSEDYTISRNIKNLKELGCQIDLDDFGTGNASITSLRQFDINRIKIDRSFVTQADRDAEQRDMIGIILSMAAQLNLETLAEGIETPGEARLLMDMGCDYLQGYHIARPLPLEEVPAWIREHEGQRSTKRVRDQNGF